MTCTEVFSSKYDYMRPEPKLELNCPYKEVSCPTEIFLEKVEEYLIEFSLMLSQVGGKSYCNISLIFTKR